MSTINRRGILPNVGYKSPVLVITIENITLSGSQTIGTVTVVNGDRVLVAAQTDPTQNGIYDVNAAGTWPRSRDFNDREDIVNGVQILNIDDSVIYRASFVGSEWLPGTTTLNFPVVTGELNSLSDVIITTPVVNEILIYNGSDFVNRLLVEGDISDLFTTIAPLANPVFTGSFTSPGIDDNATAERLQVSDSSVLFGTAGSSYSLLHQVDNQSLFVAGGNSLSNSAYLRLFGSVGDFGLYGLSNENVIYYDESLGDLEFLTGIGAKTTALNIDASQNATFSAIVTVGGKLFSSPSTTARAGFNIEEGVAPTAPTDGDVWVTAAGGYFARLNGVSINLASGGGWSPATTIITTTAYTAADGDVVLVEDGTAGGTVTITLPPVAAVNQIVVIKKLESANAILIDGAGVDIIDGGVTFTIPAADINTAITVISDGTEWRIL